MKWVRALDVPELFLFLIVRLEGEDLKSRMIVITTPVYIPLGLIPLMQERGNPVLSTLILMKKKKV